MRISGNALAHYLVDTLEANGVKLDERQCARHFGSSYILENALRAVVNAAPSGQVELTEGNVNDEVTLVDTSRFHIDIECDKPDPDPAWLEAFKEEAINANKTLVVIDPKGKFVIHHKSGSLVVNRKIQ